MTKPITDLEGRLEAALKRSENFWIYKTTYMCPLCGKEKVYRERKYDKKPKDWNLRQTLIEYYDYCDV